MRLPAAFLVVLSNKENLMEERERQLVVAHLAASRERLLELVEGLTAEQWTFRPAEGRWSIGECLEHILRVENRTLGLIGKKIAEGPPEPNKQSPTAERNEKDAMLAQMIPDRTIRRQAPEPARPVGQWPESDQLLAEFLKTRQRTAEFAATTQDDLRSYFHPHAAFGELDCYQWLIVLSLHGVRHAQQIEEIRIAPGFPAPALS
jgi:uncharacterized damage-inducible protein DinB